MRRPTDPPRRPGFTLIEILVVIVIIGILVALLVPAIGGAVRTAKNAAVLAEINQLAAALEQFKTKYTDYPPSQILLSENGFFPTTTPVGQRSVSYMRRFFPQFQISTTSAIYTTTTGWPDFNGNGTLDPPYVLQGHECLVFFLGGIPQPTSTGFGMMGFAKNPKNPFDSQSQNRNAPFFEFQAQRLALDTTRSAPSGIPGYIDSLNRPTPPSHPANVADASRPINFYAYFSAYGNNMYNPDDVNFPELDPSNNTLVGLQFKGGTTATISPPPNPYTTGLTVGARTLVFQKPNSFQIISSGGDGYYGPGGQFLSSGTALPVDTANNPYYNMSTSPPSSLSDSGVRLPEKDNLTNFHNSKLD